MRVSIDKRDPGYKHFSSIYKIKFNGEDAKYIVTADEEKGYVVRYVLDAEGKPTVAPDGRHYVLETVAGKVEVNIRDQEGRDLRLPKVKVERNLDGAIEVLVYSQIKQGAIRRVVLDKKTYDFTGKESDMTGAVRSVVSTSAGAAGEHCCKQYGDVFDPSDCAKLAVDLFDDLLKLEQTLH